MRLLPLLAASLLALGCAAEPGDELGTGTLDLTLGDTELHGTFAEADDVLEFDAREVESGIYEMQLRFHGMTLDATVDTTETLVIQRDGYTTATGEDTVMTVEDIELVARFVKTLEAQVPDIARMDGLPQHFDTVLQKWAEWIPVMALDQFEIQDPEHVSMMCWWAQNSNGSYTGCAADRWYDRGDHDCSTCSDGSGYCQTIVQLGDHCSCSGDAWVWNGSNWDCTDQGHKYRRYAVGNCYGRYGNGCGSGHGYNKESLDHDECVRNGHWTTSSWCSDELYYTAKGYDCY